MTKARPRGSVTKRGGKWAVIVSSTDPITGERQRHYSSGFTTKVEADTERTKLLASLDNGTFVAPTKMTVVDYLTDTWLPEVEDGVRPSTYESYKLHVDRYVVPRIGSTPIQKLRPDQLNAMYRDLRTNGSRTGGPLSSRTVELTHVVTRKALKDAMRWGYVARNVADAANRPRSTRSPEMKTWSTAELSRFLIHVEEHDHDRYPLWRLLVTTGMRRGEGLGARWQDLDLDAARLSVRQTLLARGRALRFGEPKTKRGRRAVALDSATVTALRRHRSHQAAEKLAGGTGYEDRDLIFAGPLGAPVHPDNISKAFKRHLYSAGLPDLNLHGLRHSHASLALQAGVHPKVVAERLGHASVALTLDVYSHVIPAMQQEAAELVAALVAGSPAG